MESELFEVAVGAALKAGELLKRGFGTQLHIEHKPGGTHNLVTEYDKAAEKLIIEAIQARFPHHAFLGEEGGSQTGQDVQWIIDPLDGTVNFAHNIPMFSVSIAAAINGQVVAGIVYNVMVGELFTAIRGRGAFLNGSRLHVSTVKNMADATLGTGLPYDAHENPLSLSFAPLTHFLKMGLPIRRIGSAAIDLAYVAAGRFDAFWEPSQQPWDYAAGLLLVEEAGGKISTMTGHPLTLEKSSIAASNGHLHPKLLKEIYASQTH